jgi:hypothetical protein
VAFGGLFTGLGGVVPGLFLITDLGGGVQALFIIACLGVFLPALSIVVLLEILVGLSGVFLDPGLRSARRVYLHFIKNMQKVSTKVNQTIQNLCMNFANFCT